MRADGPRLTTRRRQALAAIAVLAAWVVQHAACSPHRPGPDLPVYGATSAAQDAGGLSLRYFGASTLLITDSDGRSILIDGFFSRPSWRRLLTGIRPDETRIRAGTALLGRSSVLAILLAHPHHDHAMDAGVVADVLAEGKGPDACPLILGSTGAINVALGANRRCKESRPIRDQELVCVGPYKVRVFATPHTDSPLNFPGSVQSPLEVPAPVWKFKLDHNFSFVVQHAHGTVLIVPSAGLRDGGYGARADVVLLGVGGIGGWFRRCETCLGKLWDQAVRATGAGLVIPIHWDDFTSPLVDEGGVVSLPPAPGLIGDIAWTAAELKKLALDVQVATVPEGKEVKLPRYRGEACDAIRE